MIDEPALLSFLQQEYTRASDTKVNEERANALDYYFGRPFGDEEEGRSQLVTRDVAEVVDYMTVSVLRTMVSGDRVVEFEGQSEESRQAADDATALVQYDMMRRQRGYGMLHDWLKSGLLEKFAVVKSWVEQRTEVVETAVPSDAVTVLETGEAMLVDGTPVLAVVADDMMGESVVRIERDLPPEFFDVAIPSEEFLIAPDARTLDGAAYLAHKTRRTISALIEMGFSAEDVETVWDDGEPGAAVRQARDGNVATDTNVARAGTERQVWLLEEYPMFAGQRYMVQRVGTSILYSEPVDDHPFEGWSPFPLPHRVIGEALADKVMDIQRVRSVLLRQGMDNLYQANNPRVLLHESSMSDNTIDDLLTVRPGAALRWDGQVAPQPFAVPFVAGNAFQALEFMSGERESRTGITRMNQGLDADTLSKTATGQAMMQAQGQQIEEYVARNFAEAVSRMMVRKRNLMKRHGQPVQIMVDGEYREIDPSQWPDDMDTLVRVGLGTGRKEMRLQYRQLILQAQREAQMAGAPIVDWTKIYASLTGIVADMSLGSVRDYFVDPKSLTDEDGNMPEQPNPQMAAEQAKAMLQAQELEGRQRLAEADKQIEAQRATAQLELAREKAGLEADLAHARAEAEADLARDRADFEAQLAMERVAMEERLARYRIEVQASSQASDGDALPKLRPGGDLDK